LGNEKNNQVSAQFDTDMLNQIIGLSTAAQDNEYTQKLNELQLQTSNAAVELKSDLERFTRIVDALNKNQNKTKTLPAGLNELYAAFLESGFERLNQLYESTARIAEVLSEKSLMQNLYSPIDGGMHVDNSPKILTVNSIKSYIVLMFLAVVVAVLGGTVVRLTRN
jgi:uncharacterized phage infection (PIP) family protein YhgE